MPVLCRLAAGMLLAGGVVGTGLAIDAESGYAAGNASLVVSPGEGRPDGSFTATYRWLAGRGRSHTNTCVPSQITFDWDGSTLARATPTRSGNTCVATLRATPPPGRYRGSSPHTITVTSDASVRATYTVIQPQAGRPSGAPASATPPSTTDAAVPQSTGDPGIPSDAPVSAARTDNRHAWSTGTTLDLIGLGTVLFLAAAATLGIVAWRRRDALDARVPAPRAAEDTQPLPLRRGGAHRRSY